MHHKSFGGLAGDITLTALPKFLSGFRGWGPLEGKAMEGKEGRGGQRGKGKGYPTFANISPLLDLIQRMVSRLSDPYGDCRDPSDADNTDNAYAEHYPVVYTPPV